ncbi:MAG: hypothetical protein OXJ53_05575 [Gammaproteobacteria bacterium]|nr:hypothetical protein [Gammaproteobacteria bacterium]MDE0273539.1 hypothetical protein [Gammaproteobacteria bacterium]
MSNSSSSPGGVHQLPTVFGAKDADALKSALSTIDVEIRLNLRAASTEWREAGSEWRQLADTQADDWRDWLAKRFKYGISQGRKSPLRYGKEAWQTAVNALCNRNAVDPFDGWLGALPRWDGKPRLDRLLIGLFDADDNPLTRWAGAYLFIGAVQRTKEPGCKLDECPVLIGAQGIGKSAFIRSALPPAHDDWFSDALCLSDAPKVMTEALLGRVAVEISEMAGSTRAEQDRLKAFLTRRNDNSVRLAYRRNPEGLPRRCVFMGTTNRVECLPNDPSGNRRFVPVQLRSGCDVESFMRVNREQLWAEALDRHSFGERANLPRKLMADAATVAERHRSKDELIEDWLAEQADNPAYSNGVGMATLLEDAPREGGRGVTAKRLAGVARQQGWDRRKTKKSNLWFPPQKP